MKKLIFTLGKTLPLLKLLYIPQINLSWNKFRTCYHQNLGIFRCLWLFQTKVLSQNMSPPTQIAFWKYNGKSIFWNVIFWDWTLQYLKKKITIEHFINKLLSDWSRTLESAKTRKHTNTRICQFHVFSGSGTSRGSKSNQKAVFW